MAFPPCLLAARLLGAAAAAAASCPAGTTEQARAAQWRGDAYMVCEDAQPGGELQFIPAGSGSGAPISVERTAVPLFGTNATCGANTSCWTETTASSADVMGNALLRQDRDATLRELQQVIPPLVLVGGYDFNDPIQCGKNGQKPGCKAYSYSAGVHTFVGSRGSSADIVFDTLASDVMSEGHPSMNQFIHKYGLSMATFKDKLDPMVILEGLCEPAHAQHFMLPSVSSSALLLLAQGAATCLSSATGTSSRAAAPTAAPATSPASPAPRARTPATPSARPIPRLASATRSATTPRHPAVLRKPAGSRWAKPLADDSPRWAAF